MISFFFLIFCFIKINYSEIDYNHLLYEHNGKCFEDQNDCISFSNISFFGENTTFNNFRENEINNYNSFLIQNNFFSSIKLNIFYQNLTKNQLFSIDEKKKVKKNQKLVEFEIKNTINSDFINFNNFFPNSIIFYQKKLPRLNFVHTEEFIFPSSILKFCFNLLFHLFNYDNFIFKEDFMLFLQKKNLNNFLLFSLNNFEAELLKNDEIFIEIKKLRNLILNSHVFFLNHIQRYYSEDKFILFFKKNTINLDEFAYAIYILFTKAISMPNSYGLFLFFFFNKSSFLKNYFF